MGLTRGKVPLLGLAVVAVACGTERLESTLAPEPACTGMQWTGPSDLPNVVLIVTDTTRRDRLGVYGGPAQTPAFDTFARSHLWFDRAFTQSPWTKPSMATLFTSLYPSQHGLVSHPELRADLGQSSVMIHKLDVLGDGFVTLAELMYDRGYRTAAFVTNPWMSRAFGFAQGFELYEDSFARWSQTGESLTHAALGWLAGQPEEEPFFLYLHYIDAHRPYGRLDDNDVVRALDRWREDDRSVPSEARILYNDLIHSPWNRLSPGVVERLRAAGPLLPFIEKAYDRGIESFDVELGRFLEGLASHPGASHTAVIVTSDHGEALFARGYGSHGIDLFDDELAIPLAMHLPGVTARAARNDCAVGLIDLLPTLCHYLALECPATMAGRSILANEERPAYMISESVIYKPDCRTLRNGRYKLFYRPNGNHYGEGRGWALYDLAQDPGETRDLLAERPLPEETRHILRTLATRLTRAVAPFDAPEPESATIDTETLRRLEALGYLN